MSQSKQVSEGPSAEGPLTGLRILDLSRLLPGPLATRLMADQGAEVWKIEEPANLDPVRMYPPFVAAEQNQSAFYLALNRGKKSILLDTRKPEGRELLLRLAETADVLVESFRPGVLAKAGLGFDDVHARNPRLVYVSITGYGQDGPYAQLAGHDLNYQGLAGLLAATADQQGAPVHPGLQLADIGGGAYAAVQATLAALWQRERSGEGHHVDLAMTESAMAFGTLQAASEWAALAAAEPPHSPQQHPLGGALANYGIYRCRDGAYVALGALEPKFWMRFCTAVSRPEWASRMGFDPEQQAALRKDLEALFAQRDRADWVALGTAADCCLTPVLRPGELPDDPHHRYRKAISHSHDPQIRHESVDYTAGIPDFRAPGRFTGPEFRPSGEAPQAGQHTDTILANAGISARETAQLRADGTVA